MNKELGDMPAGDFRKHGYAIVDRIADYFDSIDSYPVLSQIEPGSLSFALPDSAPAAGEDFDEVLADFDRLIMPAVTHWNHPSFHGLFSTSTSSVGVFGELFAAAFDMKAMLWRTSPASTELEDTVLDWLRQMVGLPDNFEGIIYDTASVSTMHAIAAARERAGFDVREQGMSGRSDLPLLRVYCSEHVHSSIDKAVITLGLGLRSLRKIECNERFEMIPERLAEALAEDRAAGFVPICVIPTIGTTSTSSVDPVAAIADICERENVWLHVDAAYAGSAAIVPELQHLFAGWERADSIVMNPHKWLFTPFDLSVLYVRGLSQLKAAFSLVPEYLKTSEEPTVKNGMDYGIQLGRRFRSLKLWFVIRYFGREGLTARISEHCRLARLFASKVEASPNWQLMAPVPFALVCFRALGNAERGTRNAGSRSEPPALAGGQLHGNPPPSSEHDAANSPPYEGGVAPASGDGVVLSASHKHAERNSNFVKDTVENHPTDEASAPLLRKEGSPDVNAAELRSEPPASAGGSNAASAETRPRKSINSPNSPNSPNSANSDLNERIMNRINASGEAYFSHTKLNGIFTLRMSVGSIRVEERHIEKAWRLFNEALEAEINAV